MNIVKKRPELKAVLDTNIYISAILFGENPERIRKLSKEKELEILISEAIIAEIAEVLRKKFNWESWQISQIIDEIRECAVEGKVQYIVSGDKQHLLPLKEYQGVKILSPAEFLIEMDL